MPRRGEARGLNEDLELRAIRLGIVAVPTSVRELRSYIVREWLRDRRAGRVVRIVALALMVATVVGVGVALLINYLMRTAPMETTGVLILIILIIASIIYGSTESTILDRITR